MKRIFSVIIIVAMVFFIDQPGFASNGTWLNTGVTSASWVNTNNWTGATVPGATAGTTNTDIATFNTAIGANNYGTSAAPILIDSGRNISGINFDTSTGNYYIGSTSLNPILLTSAGTIQILGTLSSTNAIETINAPLIIEGASGTYTLSNNSANGVGAGAGTLKIGGAISAGASGTSVLNLSGSNTNLNTISGIITNGAATSLGVTQTGAGTWVLSGANTYTGPTTVNAGILKGGAINVFGGTTVNTSSALVMGGGTLDLGGFNQAFGSLTGTGIITTSTGSATATVGYNNTSLTNYSGTITGAVALTKVGTGTLALSGVNTYSGATNINGGVVQISAADNLGNSSSIGLNSGTLESTSGTNAIGTAFTLGSGGGIIRLDSGQLTLSGGVTGTGNLILSNNSSITDGITVSGASINNTGTLTNSGNGGGGANGSTLISAAIGPNVTGVIEDSSTSNLVLSGANTYTGATTVDAGTLMAARGVQAFGLGSALTVGSGGTLDLAGFNESIGSLSGAGTVTDSVAASTSVLTLGADNTSTTFSGLIQDGSGTTALTKTGSGVFSLNGNNVYSGGTTINGGTLQIGNSYSLGTGVVINNAILSIGSNDLILGNSYAQNSGSALDLNANSSSSFGAIISTGHAATVNSASTVNVTVGSYIPNNTILTIINTGGTGITGSAPDTINTIESGNPDYTSRVSFTSSVLDGNLILTADHTTNGFSSLADNNNARAVGRVLDNEDNPSSDMTSVLNTLEFLNNAQTTSALNTLGPVVDGGILDNSTSALNNFIGASLDRLQDITLNDSGNLADTGVSTGDDSKLDGLWAKQYGSYLTQDSRQGIPGYDGWNTGTAVGLDRRVSDDLTLGASVGYAYGQVNSANGTSTDINSAQGTIYAGYQGAQHPYFIDAAGTFARNWYNGQRDIVVGPIERTAYAGYSGNQYGAYLNGGYKINLGNTLEFTPIASLQWTHLALGSYNETNADSLDLNVNRQSYNILESGLGASIAYPVQYNWGGLTPEFHAKWLYDFMGDQMVVSSTYTGGGGSFTSYGANPAKDGINVGGKLSFNFKNDISIIASSDTEMRQGFFGISGTVTVSYKF